ncbi:MAG: S41 family peptidase, partial [Proteobacteria bacterium]|nr:S41 family peptidase [Pseudomonadota bacterium]
LHSEHGFQVLARAPGRAKSLLKINLSEDAAPLLFKDVPLVVLVNKMSGSLSELIAQVIQDHARGLVIGDSTTSGKGTMQTRFYTDNTLYIEDHDKRKAIFKVTTAKFFGASGHSVQETGLLSDIQIISLTESLGRTERDRQNVLNNKETLPAVEDINAAEPFLNTQLINALKKQSRERQQKSDDFALIQSISQRVMAADSLTLAPSQAYSEIDQILIKQKIFNLSVEQVLAEIKQIYFGMNSDFVLEEALAITRDYSTRLQQKKSVGSILGSSAN